MMKVTINNVEFKNPVIAASGTFGFGEEFNNFYDVGILGGISSKGLTINPKQGNEGIRVYENTIRNDEFSRITKSRNRCIYRK